jgi:biotin synthase
MIETMTRCASSNGNRSASAPDWSQIHDAGARTDWTLEEVVAVFNAPLLDLIYQAATVHRREFSPEAVQQCTLLSIKTGACPEDCAYCPQSARYKTSVEAEPLMNVDDVFQAAKEAKESGSTRFCMGAAWREVRNNEQFENVLDMVRSVRSLDLEVCCTLGMLTREQADRLKEAGLTAYNHNLDTSEGFYNQIITTRTYKDRLDTLANVRAAGISVCCGGIIGMGETTEDRIDLIHTLATLPEHPESVPINALVPVDGTPLASEKPVPFWELVRMIAATRIAMPKAMVRLSAGRVSLSIAEQALCFLAGANSIFTGEKLLTTPNNDYCDDQAMFDLLGLTGMKPFAPAPCGDGRGDAMHRP